MLRACCCGCSSALRPRYKRLVDNIFPVLPEDGLVKSNMDKLIFYAVSYPEKLDRIGEYLYQKAGRDIYRRRYKFVIMAMEAMDQLLIACHAHTLNLFVESFLKMVQKLLESPEPELQTMATQSFVRFANIEEDTPSYHLRYEFFVSRFSSMCHNNDDKQEIRDNLRLAGIKGLQGVLRKTVSDDLVENIWDSVHMDKIVPSLLFNIQTNSDSNKSSSDVCNGDNTPPMLAESCLRELVGRASFGHIPSVLRPVLRHFDNHKLWLPNSFAIEIFTLIMYSVQTQYSYTVIETLMSHLDSCKDPKIRTSIADVLAKIIAIAANESVGPSVLEIINSLLKHLRTSVSPPGRSQSEIITSDEKLYQEALINALGEFSNHLPDYQKIEIMMFIMGKVRYPSRPADCDASESLLENILLKSLLKVSTKYKTIHFNTTFPSSFLEPLLQMSLAPDPEMRIIVQNIFHTLIDRHGNLPKLLKPTISVSNLGLRIGKCSRSDMIFIRKHGSEIFTALYESLELINNTIENFLSVYTTMALLTLELLSEETMIDVIRLLLSVQDMTLTSTSLSANQKAHLHAIVISVFILIPWVVGISTLEDYAQSIIGERRQTAPHLLPPLGAGVALPSAVNISSSSDSAMLQLEAVIECLQQAGHDAQRMLQAPGYVTLTHRHSWVDSGMAVSASAAAYSADASTDIDSVTSSPGFQKKHIEDALTFDSLKRILTETAEARKAIEDERRVRISEFFKTATFQELLQRNTQHDEDDLESKLAAVFGRINPRDGFRSPIDQRKMPAARKLGN